MSKRALEETSYELIKSHILDPDSSPLSSQQQEQLDRIISVSKILDRNPIQRQAVALHQAKYPTISRSQAYMDVQLATRLFNTLHSFDWDFWRAWLINDIVRTIEKARNDGSPQALRVVAMEHRNLIEVIGEKPQELEDPKRLEKQSYYILIQNNNNTIKLDVNTLHSLPTNTLREINRLVFAGAPLSDQDVETLFNT